MRHSSTQLSLRHVFVSALAILFAVTGALAQSDFGDRTPGVSMRVYDIGRGMRKIRRLVPGQTPNVNTIVPTIEMLGSRGDFAPYTENFMIILDGFIDAPEDGDYGFILASDDGAKLWISGELVVDNDGEHGTVEETGVKKLPAGLHPFQIVFFQSVGEKDLYLKWRPPGQTQFVIVPNDVLSCPKGQVRVTSPGKKELIMPLLRGRPGDGRELEDVHPSYDLTTVRPDDFTPRVGGIDWLSDGRMVLCTWDSIGGVYLLEGVTDENPNNIIVKRIAAGFAEPLGVTVVDDEIYILQKQELTKLIDHDGDDIIDEYYCVCSGWNVSPNFHEFAFGLVYEDGYFYGNLATAIVPGGASVRPQIPDRGSTLKISKDQGTFEIMARGLRTPNGIGFGVDGEIFLTDNQGDWLPVSKVLHLKEDAFYGSRSVLLDEAEGLTVTPPVVWLPQGEIGNSPATSCR
ncbi:MAG: PA14 domain-containing protein [Planctomycetota bacterium]|nr:PA14 domain-containing protein [Planctomycetota bacterium]